MRQTSIISLAGAAALVIATCGGAFAQSAKEFAPGQQKKALETEGSGGKNKKNK